MRLATLPPDFLLICSNPSHASAEQFFRVFRPFKGSKVDLEGVLVRLIESYLDIPSGGQV